MMSWWIKIHRKMKERERYDDNNTKILFLHLLLSVNHEEKRRRGNVVKPWQIITSLWNLAEQTNLSIRQVRTSLEKLKSTWELTSQVTSRFSLITLCCWDKYQSSDKQVTSNMTSKWQSDDKQVTTTKEWKEYKEWKEKRNNWATKLLIDRFDEFWSKYPLKKWKKRAKDYYIRKIKTIDKHKELMKWLEGYIKEHNRPKDFTPPYKQWDTFLSQEARIDYLESEVFEQTTSNKTTQQLADEFNVIWPVKFREKYWPKKAKEIKFYLA